MQFCTNCGTSIPDGKLFCTTCGKQVNTQQPSGAQGFAPNAPSGAQSAQGCAPNAPSGAQRAPNTQGYTAPTYRASQATGTAYNSAPINTPPTNRTNNFSQQPYGQANGGFAPNNNYQQPQQSSSGMAIAALVCGILGIIGSFIPIVMYFTFVLAVLGIIFGANGLKKAKMTGVGNGLATTGLVLGIIGTAFGLIGVICAVCVLAATGSALNSLSSLPMYY